MSGELITIERAREEVLACASGPAEEPVPLADAVGRILAVAAVSEEDVPGFANSAMDGFAVRAADLAGAGPRSPVRLPVIDESRAGTPAERSLAPGEAIAISTGAMIPTGADAVVRVEDTSSGGDGVEIVAAVEAGANVRRAGEDIAAGTEVLAAGSELGPAELGVLGSVGVGRPLCARRPALAMLSTGDELIGPDEPLRPGAVRNSNALTVPALARAAGAAVTAVDRIGDDPDATRELLATALTADVLVVSGGVSVGEHDHVRPALAELGVEQRFWGVALKPGKPTFFGTSAEGGLVFGLPGNPVSAMVTFILFVVPALRAMQGADPAARRSVATLGADHEKRPGRAEAVRCRLEPTDSGWLATPTGAQDSHLLTSMLGAGALAILPAESGPVRRGDRVEIELLR